MASKRKPEKKNDPNQITALVRPDEDEGLFLARTALRPTVQAAVTLKEYISDKLAKTDSQISELGVSCHTPTETLIKKATSNEMAFFNIESNASDGEIGCLRVAFNRHCQILDYLSKSLRVELEFKTARKNKKLSA
jgi:hypothetical protein